MLTVALVVGALLGLGFFVAWRLERGPDQAPPEDLLPLVEKSEWRNAVEVACSAADDVVESVLRDRRYDPDVIVDTELELRKWLLESAHLMPDADSAQFVPDWVRPVLESQLRTSRLLAQLAIIHRTTSYGWNDEMFDRGPQKWEQMVQQVFVEFREHCDRARSPMLFDIRLLREHILAFGNLQQAVLRIVDDAAGAALDEYHSALVEFITTATRLHGFLMAGEAVLSRSAGDSSAEHENSMAIKGGSKLSGSNTDT